MTTPRTRSARRRASTVLASASAAVLVGTGVAAAHDDQGRGGQAHGDRTHGEQPPAVDEASGFDVEILAPHATFPDDVRAQFGVSYDHGPTLVSNLPHDAGTVVQAEVTWAAGGTSGWHTHPGPVVVAVTDGEVEVTNARDCTPRTYEAGEAFLDPGQGNVHIATNPSDSDEAIAYATFLGVPDGEPATVWVEPADCEAAERRGK